MTKPKKSNKLKKAGFSIASLALISVSTILPGCRVNVRHNRRGVFVGVEPGINIDIGYQKNFYPKHKTIYPPNKRMHRTKRYIYSYLQKRRIPFSLNPLIEIKTGRTTRYLHPDFMIKNHLIELSENNELRNKTYMQNKQELYSRYKKGKIYTLSSKNKEEIEKDIENIIEEIYD